jgi:hypothetical protein
MVITFKEAEIRKYLYSRSSSVIRIKNGKTIERDFDEVFENFKKTFEEEFTFENDISVKHFNGKVGKGKYLMVVNDKVIYKKNRPYWLSSPDSCKSFLISHLSNYVFKQSLNLEPYIYHQTIPPADAIYKDMEESDFIEIFKNDL